MQMELSSLHDAIKKDDAEAVTAFLDAGVDVNARDVKFDYALLALAAYYCSTNVARVLFERGAHENILQKDFDLALTYAATSNNTELLQMFLEHGNQLLVTKRLQEMLNSAAWSRSYQTMQPLVEHGAVVTASLLLTAASAHVYSDVTSSEHHAKTVEFVLAHGVDINTKDVSHKNTALMLSAQSGSLPTVKLLIERGARINAKNGGGKTALKMAMAANHADIVAFLLKSGAKP